METKSAREKFWNSQLEYLNRKPLLEQASAELDTDWMQMVMNDPDKVDPEMLFLKNKQDLPTKKNTLVLFHFFRNLDKSCTKSLIAEKVWKEIEKYWLRSNVPTQTVWWTRKEILNLNSSYEKLLKNIKRENETECGKRESFVASLVKLFDISSPLAEKQLRKDQVLGMNKAKEDLMFLDSQRTDRVAKMMNHDKKYDRQVLKVKTRKAKQTTYKANTNKKLVVQFDTIAHAEDNAAQENNNDRDFEPEQNTRKRKSDTVTLEVPRKLFKSPDVVSMIDRTQVSSRKAVGITSSILKAGGADLTDFTISHRQVHRQRDKSRSVLAQQAMAEFKANKPDHLALHWDSKLVDDSHGTKHERLAVLTSGAPNYIEGKLLGVPSLVGEDGQATSTGEAQFEGAKDLVKIWDLKNSVRGLVFDTTASNLIVVLGREPVQGWSSG